MKNINRFILLLLTAAVMLNTTGCWNYREIEKLGIVSACAIDKADNEYVLTIETITISTSRNGNPIKPYLLKSSGKSIFEAIRNTISKSGRKLYWGHTKVILVSQEIAKEGILPILDWIFRGAEIRGDSRILISMEKTAGELLNSGKEIESTVGMHLDNILETQKFSTLFPNDDLWEFMAYIVSEGVSAIAPSIRLIRENSEKFVFVRGTALFKKDKLIGWLDGEESKLLLWIKDDILGGTLFVENVDEDSKNITLEIFRNHTALDPEFVNDELVMNINILSDFEITELGESEVSIDPKGIEKLQTITEETIKARIENFINKIQKEYKTDVFGFGNAIMKKMPKYWKEIKNSKGEVFEDMKIVVNVKVNIKGSALISEQLKAGD